MDLQHITISGIDDTVPIDKVLELAEKYPKMEIGILLSRDEMGRLPRYPSLTYIMKLCQHSDTLKLSAHICRGWMIDLLKKQVSIWPDLRHIWDHFSRVQFNYYTYFTRGDIFPASYSGKARQMVESIAHPCFANKELIFPYSMYSKRFLDEFLVIDPARMSIFYDDSAGIGKELTEVLPPYKNCKQGYAGSLGPSNLSDILNKIKDVAGETPVWADSETQLMYTDHKNNPERNHWDMERVEQFLKIGHAFT